MPGGVVDGQAVSAAVTNPAFLFKNADDTALGVITLGNASAPSGTTVNNTQEAHNAISSYTGMPINSVKTVLPAWISSFIGTISDTLLMRIEAIVLKFKDTTGAGGHAHSGVDGDGAIIPLSNTSGILPISQGGTGQNTATDAYDALSPNTTKGDITVHGVTDNIRLPVGTNGHVLTADSVAVSGVKWAAATAGASNAYPTTSIAGNLVILSGDTFAVIFTNTSAARSITFPDPAAVGSGRFYTVKDITGTAATNNITMIRNAAEQIEGLAASKILQTNFGSWTFITDGTNWYLI